MSLSETETDPFPTAAEPKFSLLLDGVGIELAMSSDGGDGTELGLPKLPLGRLDKDPDSILVDPESKMPSDGVGMELASSKSCAADTYGSRTILFDD